MTATVDAANVGAILDRVEESLEQDLLPVEIFNDQAIFAAEMERIFAKSWLFVAHESELPNPGDFVLRRIGLDPVIVTRDGEGEIHVLSNYCRHRGTQVCQTDKGNSRFFKCPYHGWAYSNDGRLVGTPHMHDAYGKPLDPDEWGLIRAPKVGARQGFVFASLDASAPSLDEYLGGGGWMLDLIIGLHPDGMRVAGPPDRFRIRGDWKTAAENLTGDVYHVDNLHQSTQEIGIGVGLEAASAFGRPYELDNGHNFTGHAWTKIINPEWVLWGYPPEIKEHFDLSGLDETQLHVINHEPPTVGTIFPNFSFLRFATLTVSDGMTVITSFRQWQPIGPGEIEMWNWHFVWDFMSEDDVRRAYNAGQFTFGSAGIFEQDDTVVWEGVARAGASPWMRQAGMRLHFQQGNDSEVDQSPDSTWAGPGIKRNTGYGEHAALAFYRHWLKVMREGAGNGAAAARRNGARATAPQEG